MTIDSAVAKLQVQQQSMAEDMRDMKGALNSIAKSLEKLSLLEQKQADVHGDIEKTNVRIDKTESLIKDEFKNHEKRLQSIEIAFAKNIWIERIVMSLIMAGVIMWLKGTV